MSTGSIDVSAKRQELLRERIPKMPIIILAKNLEPESHVISFQDYVMNGESIIPLFSSESAFRESTGDGDLQHPTVAIDRSLLVSVLHGHEILMLDPSLPSEIRFTAVEFRAAFPEPFEDSEAPAN